MPEPLETPAGGPPGAAAPDDLARAGGPPAGATRVRADRALRIGLIGVLAGALLTTSVALFLPRLIALDPRGAGPVHLLAVLMGMVAAIATAAFGPSGEPPGARLATRIGLVLSASGVGTITVAALIALPFAPLHSGRLDRSDIAAITAGGIGLSLVVAVIASLAASFTRSRIGIPSAGMPLAVLVGGAAGVVTAATWALATAHLVGHLHAAARQNAVGEARDLAYLLAERSPEEIESLASELAPPGGFVGRIGADGALVAGSGLDLPRDARILLTEGPPTLCRVTAPRHRPRTLPCDERPLADGTRLVAAVSELPVPLGSLLRFIGVGVGAALLALLMGYTLGRGPADELARVARVLDELARPEGGAGGLDRPIVAVSLDEVGDLAVALALLRRRLRPGLVEHDAALARARAADSERDRLLSLVSDELRTPLDRILGAARLLLDDTRAELSAEQREDVRLIVSSATHLTGLIEEVLDLSAIATGQLQLRLADVDLGAMLSEVARAQRPLLGSRQVELRVELPERPARLYGDERRLRQVVTNLVSNAVKFTSAGSISLTVGFEEQALVLTVRDTGSGMDTAQIPRLFSDFVQLGNLRQRARGTGLGLAICKRLIDAHRGSISAESALGVGTTFTVRLPIAAASPSQARAPAPGHPAPSVPS